MILQAIAKSTRPDEPKEEPESETEGSEDATTTEDPSQQEGEQEEPSAQEQPPAKDGPAQQSSSNNIEHTIVKPPKRKGKANDRQKQHQIANEDVEIDLDPHLIDLDSPWETQLLNKLAETLKPLRSIMDKADSVPLETFHPSGQVEQAIEKPDRDINNNKVDGNFGNPPAAFAEKLMDIVRAAELGKDVVKKQRVKVVKRKMTPENLKKYMTLLEKDIQEDKPLRVECVQEMEKAVNGLSRKKTVCKRVTGEEVSCYSLPLASL